MSYPKPKLALTCLVSQAKRPTKVTQDKPLLKAYLNGFFCVFVPPQHVTITSARLQGILERYKTQHVCVVSQVVRVPGVPPREGLQEAVSTAIDRSCNISPDV